MKQRTQIMIAKLAAATYFTFLIGAAALGWASAAQSAGYEQTRLGSCEFTCSTFEGERISCHNGFGNAVESCVNRALDDGQQYKILADGWLIRPTGVTPPPDPEPALGAATLSWNAPTTNIDGSPLADLAGYRIYFGNSESGPFENRIDIGDPTATTFVVENLAPGFDYYFYSTAVNADGFESDPSNIAHKRID